MTSGEPSATELAMRSPLCGSADAVIALEDCVKTDGSVLEADVDINESISVNKK